MICPNVKNLKYIIKVYGFNLTNIDITGISFSGCDLRQLKFRKDRNLFQKIDGKNLSGTKLPNKDYSRYNFKGVLLKNVIFSSMAHLPANPDFFQKIRKKDISHAVMPIMDYSNYNFKNVCIKGTKFPANSVLPKDYQFFQKIKYKDCRGTELPIETQKSLHLYNLKDVRINLSDYNLTSEQIYVIYKKTES